MNYLDGKPVAESILNEARAVSEKLKRPPKLAFLRVGENEADVWYENAAAKVLKKAGIMSESVVLKANVRERPFLSALRKLNRDETVDGILILMPLPESVSVRRVSETIDPEKDMDGISVENMAALYSGQPGIRPCTAEAVVSLLDYYGIDIRGKRAVVVGRSPVVGRPVASLLIARDATVTVCHSKTADLTAVSKSADILVSAVGKPCFLTKKDVKTGAVVVDVGTSAGEDGKLCGDVDEADVKEKVSWLSGVVGGVGTVTTAILALHTAKAAEKRQEP